MSTEKISANSHDERVSYDDEPKLNKEHIRDGDLALKVLHTNFEPYTEQEEKRLVRKIDFRLALLMLFVNGIQFVDKLVSCRFYLAFHANSSRRYRKPPPMVS